MTVYRKTMADAYREIYSLNEDNMDLMRKAAKGAMQTIKFKDGKLKVDSFTASGIMAVYDKINPKNKESMEKMINSGTKGQILKLQSLAMKASGRKEEVEVDEAKSATGYELYHKTFSGAMQHAYAHAKKKFGITVNPNEIDQKVASGPAKPSKGKTNKYGLKGDKGGIQVQVYNTGKNYELNMYKEEVVKEGTWQLPQGNQAIKGLKRLLTKPIELGKMANNAKNKIDKYLGDDELFDDLEDAADKNPKGDARPIIKKAMKRLNIREDISPVMSIYQNAISKLVEKTRQLKDPKKEMMIKSKDSGVMVIDKKDFKKYEKKGYFAVEETEVDEHKGKKKHKHPHIMTKDGELATVDEKFDRKKFDDNEDKNFHTENGVALVNMFGDAYEKRQIAQIKKDHDKRGSITSKDQKVRDALVKKYLPKLKEEVELDESVIEQLKSLAKGGSRYKPKSGAVEIKDDKGKVINKLTPEGAKKVLDKMKDPISGKSSVPDRTRGGAEKKIIDIVKNFKEEVDLDEAKGVVQPTKDGKGVFKVLPRDTKGMSGKQDAFSMGVYDKSGKKLIKDWGSHPSLEGAKKFARNHGIIEDVAEDFIVTWKKKEVARHKTEQGARKLWHNLIDNPKKYGIKQDKIRLSQVGTTLKVAQEGVDLDEGPNKMTQPVIVMRHKDNKNLSVSVLPSAKNIKEKEKKGMRIDHALVPSPSGNAREVKDPKEIMKLIKGGDKLKIGEEVEIVEGKMKELHMYIQQGKKPEWIAKTMGLDVKTVKSLMSEETMLEKVNRFLESARSDAMRAMRKSGEFKDKDDDDVTASDDDVKAASKNIIAQMRKVVSLRGNFKVEFQDGKKEKIDPKIAQSIQQKYNSMRKPADKEKFQAKIAKSKRDLLNALKESFGEAKDDQAPDQAKKVQAKQEKEKEKETKQKQTDAIKDRQTSVADAQKAKQEAEREKASNEREKAKQKANVDVAQASKKKEMDTAKASDKATSDTQKAADQKEKEAEKRAADTERKSEKAKKASKSKEVAGQLSASYNPILSRIDEKIQERKNG